MDFDDAKPIIIAEEKPAIQEEADEILEIPTGELDKVWLVKVPKFLRDAWSSVNADGIRLATLRVYSDQKTISLILPPLETDTITAECPREYKLNIQNKATSNVYMFAEQPKDLPDGRTVAKTSLSGKVVHECSITPEINDSYRKIMAARRIAESKPKRTAILMEDRSEISKLTTGGFNNKKFASNFTMDKDSLKTGDRLVRMPANELLDILFGLFAEYKYWDIKGLKLRTRQPVTYLREILQEIAIQAKGGTYANKWYLKEERKIPALNTGAEEMKPNLKSEDAAFASSSAVPFQDEILSDEEVLDSGDDDDDGADFDEVL